MANNINVTSIGQLLINKFGIWNYTGISVPYLSISISYPNSDIEIPLSFAIWTETLVYDVASSIVKKSVHSSNIFFTSSLFEDSTKRSWKCIPSSNSRETKRRKPNDKTILLTQIPRRPIPNRILTQIQIRIKLLTRDIISTLLLKKKLYNLSKL